MHIIVIQLPHITAKQQRW